MKFKKPGLLILISAALFATTGNHCLYGAAQIEAQAFSSALAAASGAGKFLESGIGGVGAVKLTGTILKSNSGFSPAAHSPGVVDDLTVSTGPLYGEGKASLTWTEKGLDGALGRASEVIVKIATFPITNNNYSSIASSLTLTAGSPSAAASAIYPGISPGPVYYAALRVKDSAGTYGRISASVPFMTSSISPDPVTTLAAVSIASGAMVLSWQVTGNDGDTGDLNPGYFHISYASVAAEVALAASGADQVQLTTYAAAGSLQHYTQSGLLGNTTYYARVFIGDDAPSYSVGGNISTALTMPYPPAAGGFTNITSSSFTVSFSAYNSSDTAYYIQVSSRSDFASASGSGWFTGLSFGFQDFTAHKTYFARGKTRSRNLLETAYEDLGSVFLTYPPVEPTVSGALSGGAFTIAWPAVSTDIYGSTTEVRGYEVYSATAAGGVLSTLATLSSTTLNFTQAVSGDTWYFVKAVDLNGVKSSSSLWLKNTARVSRIISDDLRAAADISPELGAAIAARGLRAKLDRQSDLEGGSVTAAYKLYFLDAAGRESYPDFTAEVLLSLPVSRTAAVSISAAAAQTDYGVFYDNGIEDVKLGGSVSAENGIITVGTKKAGMFKVKRVARAGKFVVTQTVPRKIFTPNGDGIWDEFNILYDNPEGLDVSDAKVYDLNGRETGELKKGAYNTGQSLYWDGKRKGGAKAEAGVYIYQFKAGNKYYNGTIVLAR